MVGGFGVVNMGRHVALSGGKYALRVGKYALGGWEVRIPGSMEVWEVRI